MAGVPLFALFCIILLYLALLLKFIKQTFSDIYAFLLHKITLLTTSFFYGFDEFFINLKAQNQGILSKKSF